MSSFSAYLVGLYERRLGVTTTLHIINPTPKPLNVISAFYDDQEQCQTCFKFQLTPNDLQEINASRLLGPDKALFGVVKIISYEPGTETPRPQDGIVGFQRQLLATGRGPEFSETVLASVPTEVAHEELPKIWEHCRSISG
ncbi:MAG: hypothetical protein AB4040_18020 [Synechococcus sp.]